MKGHFRPHTCLAHSHPCASTLTFTVSNRLMESAGYFDESRCQWSYALCPLCDPSKDKTCRHKLRHGVLYDGGVDRVTIGRCNKHGFRCVKTGTKRSDAKSTLSNVGRSLGQNRSILRIRVENKIGDGKGRCKIIGGRVLSIHQLAHAHKIVFDVYVLMNFNTPTIV